MKQERINSENSNQYPEGHFVRKWMAICIALFSGFGIPISIATGNHAFIGIGPALGISIGLSIGSSIEAKHRQEGKIIPLTEEEKKRKKLSTTFGIMALVVLVLTGILLFLLRV